MLDTLELTRSEGWSSRQPHVSRSRAPIAVLLLRLIVVAVIFATLRELPIPMRDVVVPLLGVVVPSILWTGYVRNHSTFDLAGSAGAGLVIVLAGWSVLEFLILLARLGSSLWTSLAALILLSAIPLSQRFLNLLSAPRRIVAALGRIRLSGLAVGGLLLVSFGVGAAIIELSMRMARRATDDASQSSHFAVFWLGVLVMLVPVFVQIVRREPRMTAPLIVVLSAAAYVPYWLRGTSQPAVTDEIAHWGETLQMFQSGRLFVADHVVTMGPHFPGLETLSVGLSGLGGAPDFHFMRLLVLLFHVASVLGIYQLGRLAFAGRTAPSVFAAALYAISPGFLLVDSWYSYESFAVPLMIWALAALILYSRACESDKRPAAAATLLFAALIITHHLTSYVAVASVLLLLMPAAAALRRRSAGSDTAAADVLSPRRILWLGVGVGFAVTGWAVVTRAAVIHYLVVFPNSALSAAGSLLSGHGLPSSSASNTASGRFNGTRAFGSSYLPVYEHVASIASQILLLVWFGLAVRAMWPRRNAVNIFFASLGILYFISLPATFISGAGQGAHRSWAFSFVGLVLTLPYFSPSMAEIAVRTKRLLWLRRPLAMAVALTVLLVGNYGSSVSALYRFPGKFVMGADGRGYSPDMIRSAEWFRKSVGTEQAISTTGRDFIIFGAYAQARKSKVNGWTLFYPTGALAPSVHTALLAADTHYVVVDTRLDSAANQGYYFELWEPRAPSSPLPRASIAKFSSIPWLTLVHQDGFTQIYRVSPA